MSGKYEVKEWTVSGIRIEFYDWRRDLKGSGIVPSVPSAEFLEAAVKIATHLQGRNQKIKSLVDGRSLWMRVNPSGIFIEVTDELIRIWLEFEGKRNSQAHEVWKGIFGKFLREKIDYKEVKIRNIENYLNVPRFPKKVDIGGIEDIKKFLIEPWLDKLIRISEGFRHSQSKLKKIADEYEEGRERLYEDAKNKLSRLFSS